MKIGGKGYRGGAGFSNTEIAYASALVNVANICLLLALLYVYIRSYRRLKSNFTLGLMLFAFLLLLQNTFFLMFFILQTGFRGPGMGVPLLTINSTQLIALIILLKITWE
ncbi:MAG: hypothetical protein ACP5C3_10070 [Methanomicrobiales archaeon]